MVVATEKLDVVVVLVKVESQITTTLGAFHNAGEHAGLLRNGCASAACGMQALHLFPTDTVNDILLPKQSSKVFYPMFIIPLPTAHVKDVDGTIRLALNRPTSTSKECHA